MASDIERLAEGLRQLASEAHSRGREVTHTAQGTRELMAAAQAQSRSGLVVAPLVGQLQAACKRAADAAAAIEQVAAHGESFADHLAATRQSHQSHPIRDGALAAFAAYMVADTPLPYVSSTDVSCDVGTHEVAGAGAAIGRAADEHDKWEAASSLGKRSSDDVTEHSKGHGQ